MRRLHLRVLYTINSSSYILARSPAPVLVTPVNPDAAELEPYGSVSFKTCLEAICRSSPELVPNSSRDFSVYVLDPLESNAAPAPIDISNSSGSSAGSSSAQTRGVAVGMGSMSLALAEDEQEPVSVIGTLSKTGAGQDALEVIIALREIAQQSTSSSSNSNVTTRSSHTSSSKRTMTASETLATIASIQNRAKPKNKPKKPPRVSSTPITESDKLLDADTYVGPVKKKGRPKGTSHNEVKVKVEESSTLSSAAAHNSFQASSDPKKFTNVESSPTTVTTHSTSNETLAGHPTVAPYSSSPDFSSLALLFSSTQNEAARNASLLKALNFIDASASQSGSQQSLNAALINALRQLLDNAYLKAQSISSSPPASQSSVQFVQAPSQADNDVVLVDKENVAPTTFRQHAERQRELAKLAGSNSQTNTPSVNSRSPEGPVLRSRGLGARSIENTPPKTQLPAQSASLPTNGLLRKRTLDDCMEERDNKRSRAHRWGKEKERTGRKEPSRSFLSQLNLRHYPGPVASVAPRSISGSTSYYRKPVDPWTSPPRPSREESISSQSSLSSLGGSSRSCPIVIPDSPQAPAAPRVSASSPIKPSVTSKRPYIVPTWARTGTATQPRLSEKARLAAIEAEQKKREERRANKRKSNAASARERSRQRGGMITEEDEITPTSETTRPQDSMPPSLPVEPQSDLPPIVASNDTTLNLFPSPVRRVRSPSPTPKSHLPPPVTPKRPSKSMYSTSGIMGANDDSLFTPISIARRSTGTHGSPLFSPGMFGSPLARKSAKMSPTLRRSYSGQFDSESSVTVLQPSEKSEDTLIKSKNSTQEGQEEFPDELDCPPSSLPFASSDIESDDKTMDSFVQDKDSNTGDDEDDEYASPRKQHWVGLPPSSPPPPSSPNLMPVGDDAEIDGPYHACEGAVDEELPIASEEDEAENEQRDGVFDVTGGDWAPRSADADADADDLTVTLQDYSATSFEAEQAVVDEFAFFKEFTTIGSTDDLSDDLSDLPEPSQQNSTSSLPSGINSLFTSNPENMDLKGFWDAFKAAALDGPVPDTTEQTAAFDLSTLESFPDSDATLQPVDHKKLAADLQALFSGCLV
ncbi:hypothetical protein AGABI1DRAFT_126795 [Agaricus bisporus var. burnettii JB137-S8]|uniref:Ams2/SPT21 N-terminal domain-containing protein n=1 Tax=Agaricus bisporus var. burnettii (strain JB137-S8 / ATCC MYA-4627 / FGSC 10392) TaxID=597362 RepID=K5XBS7_AGABU|nr:uncharacterized protein AGABI1DRAFT_126795 [Agaricus bisporus var. burnettii JB137-S8]EKM80748.1 hypothetical protein AGABI1DRAFT_126795 [Agaricus bisporus var. burnettii JB137-S8]